MAQQDVDELQDLSPEDPAGVVRRSPWWMVLLSTLLLVVGLVTTWVAPRYCEHRAQTKLQSLSRRDGPTVVISEWPTGPQWLESRLKSRLRWLTHRVKQVRLADLELNDVILDQLAMFREVEYLSLENVTFAEESSQFPRLPKLRLICVSRVADCERILAASVGSETLTELTLAHAEANEQMVDHLASLPNLSKLALVDVPFHAGQLRRLPLRQLEQLCLRKTSVTNLDLVPLADCTSLRFLDLTGNRGVGDAGLWSIRVLPQLEILLLSGTSVTNDGVLRIRDLPQLRRLSLSQTAVTLAGLMELDRSQQLTKLKPPFDRPSEDWGEFLTLLPHVTLYQYFEDDEHEDIPRNFFGNR